MLHAHDVAANLLSIGAIDFGIVIDGTVVMIENIYRELALREGQDYNLNEVILAAAKDVDRPIFYSVAVILAGYLPIYALQRAIREAVSSHGGDDVLRSGRSADPYLDPDSGAGVLLVQERRAGENGTAPSNG